MTFANPYTQGQPCHLKCPPDRCLVAAQPPGGLRYISLEIAATFVTETPAELIETAARIDAWLDGHGDAKGEPFLSRSLARQALELAHRRACVFSGNSETLLSYAEAILTVLMPPAEHRRYSDAE